MSWVCIVLGVLVTIVGSIGGMRDIVRPFCCDQHALPDLQQAVTPPRSAHGLLHTLAV